MSTLSICKSYASVEILPNIYLYKVELKIMTLPALILHNTNSKHSINPLIQGLYEESLGVLLTKVKGINSNIDIHINVFTNDQFQGFQNANANDIYKCFYYCLIVMFIKWNDIFNATNSMVL